MEPSSFLKKISRQLIPEEGGPYKEKRPLSDRPAR
jgi:hypothetical protein